MSEYPIATVNILSSNIFASLDERNILLVGQKTSAGSATSGELKNFITANELNSFFNASFKVLGMKFPP